MFLLTDKEIEQAIDTIPKAVITVADNDHAIARAQLSKVVKLFMRKCDHYYNASIRWDCPRCWDDLCKEAGL